MSVGERGVLEHVVGAATAGIGLVGPRITVGGSCLTAWCRTVRPQCCTCQLSCVSVGRTLLLLSTCYSGDVMALYISVGLACCSYCQWWC